MKVLLLGAAGLVGSHLRSAFHAHEVLGTTRDGAGDTISLDVRDNQRMRAIAIDARPEAILAAAADAYVERCEGEPEATRAVNVDAIRHIAEISDELNATLVVFSSEYVFDGTRGSYDEDDEVRPLNEYGRQKMEVERLARNVARHLIVRTSGVFGREARRKNFVLQVVDRLRGGHEVRVPFDQLITPTYAQSLATAVEELLVAQRSGTYHIVGPRILARDEFARLIADCFDLPRTLVRPVATAELGLIARRPPRAGLSDAKLHTSLGHGTTPIEIGLRELARAKA